MQRIYAIGETVLDIIFKDDLVQAARPGGAMLNTAVSLGRAGLQASLITEYACDRVGDLIHTFLSANGVGCQHVYRYERGKTSLAMAFLDDRNDASYVFYKMYPEARFKVKPPRFDKNDIVLFGSFFGVDPNIRERVLATIEEAKSNGAMVIYDPNFRKPHAHELPKLLPYIRENIRMADIVRGSDEDFSIIFGTSNVEEVREHIGHEIQVLIMTRSATAVYLDAGAGIMQRPVRQLQPVSTIGAGDNFNAGLIYGLIKERVTNETLGNVPASLWEKIIGWGVDFASDVCMQYDNYISEDFAGRL